MAGVDVEVFGRSSIRVRGEQIPLSLAERRTLAALCILDGPIDLVSLARDVLHISPSTIRPLLSRLARRLDVDRVHRPAEPRSGRVLLADAEVQISSDIERFRRTAVRVLGTTPPDLGALLACDNLWVGGIDEALDLPLSAVGPLAAAAERAAQLCLTVRNEALRQLPRPLRGADLERVRAWTADVVPSDSRWWLAALVGTLESEPSSVPGHFDRWRASPGATDIDLDAARALVMAHSTGATRAPRLEPARFTAGRTRELMTIRTLIDDLRGGRGAALRVTGGAGMGKTHLLVAACATSLDVHVGSVDLDQVTVADDVWQALLAGWWTRLLESDGPKDALARIIEPIEGLFGWRATSAQPGYGAAFATRAVRSLLRLPGPAPLVLVVDNADRADDQLAQSLVELASNAAGLGVLVLISCRTPADENVRWAHLPTLELGALDRASIVELVAHSSSTPLRSSEVDEIARRSRGNPLVVLALTSHPRGPAAAARVPLGAGGNDDGTDVAELLLETLPDEDRLVLGVAAVTTVGVEFDIDLVEGLLEPERRLKKRLRDMIGEAAVVAPSGNGWARFLHRQWQEVCYDGLDTPYRRELHRRIFRTLQLEHSTASRVYTRALELAPVDLHFGLRVARATCARMDGRWDDSTDDLLVAADLAADDGDDHGEAEALLGAALVTWAPGSIDNHLRMRLSALLARLPIAEMALRSRVAACLAGGLYQDGTSAMQDDHEPLIRDVVHGHRRLPNAHQQALLLIHARKAVLGHCSPVTSLRLSRRILSATGPHGDLRAEGMLGTIVDLIRLGRVGAARQLSTRYAELADRTGSPVHAYVSATLETMWALADGRLDDARTAVSTAEALAHFGGSTSMQVVRGQALLIALDGDEYREHPDTARAIAGLLPPDGPIPLWSAARAWMLARTGLVDEAAAAMQSLIEITAGFRQVVRGPMRVGLLALAIETAWRLTRTGRPLDDAVLLNLAAALSSEHDRVVLVGWPTGILGPTDLYRAMLVEMSPDGVDGDAVRLRTVAAHFCRTVPGVAARCVDERA